MNQIPLTFCRSCGIIGINRGCSIKRCFGTAKLVYTFGDLLREDIFKSKNEYVSSRELIRMAKERRNGSLGYAEVMLELYNRKCKYPLRRNNLYSKAQPFDDVDESSTQDYSTDSGTTDSQAESS